MQKRPAPDGSLQNIPQFPFCCPVPSMQEFLFVLASLIVAFALRCCRTLWLRKVGAAGFLVSTFLTFYFLFDRWWAGLIGVLLWFIAPLVDLFTRFRRMRMPLGNRITRREAPSPQFFPQASRIIKELDEAGFEHVEDTAWEWVGMSQFFQIFWHAEWHMVASVCLCEHGDVAFAFVTISGRSLAGDAVHTTNYPFSPALKHPPGVSWKHLPCEKNSVESIRTEHLKHLEKLSLKPEDLRIPDPDTLVDEIEAEMAAQIEHNLEHGLISQAEKPDHFRYSTRGLFFLWKQTVKDMVRLC